MLRQRILTAIVLLALFLPALFSSSPWPFWGFTALMIWAAGWEWGRLNGLKGLMAWILGLLTCALAWLMYPFGQWTLGVFERTWLWTAATLGWVVFGGLALRAGPRGWGRMPSAIRQLLGVGLLALAWLAMLGARERGVNFLMSVFCLVWVADSAAYLGGRLLGRHKLALTISPGKTWEGAFSGVLAVVFLALGWSVWVDTASWAGGPSFFGTMRAHGGLLGMWIAAACLTALAVVGDLFESLLKRSVGVKDSSGLLPGHGGVLDRIDALVPVFPAAMALCALKEWGP